ncbi:MAG TPA: TetR/AcrR family transcriptional regulator [Steroidobacteraceae bacterium]|jgi:TetR/AcrR family transcriptional repressor of nem operon|nr:TetR/AcrR family transcriptional regulator [Steroidobacteraceae bacterium]
MGHSKASKASTHARLVETAAAKFKERGIDGISLSDLMKDLKLTHGGFYRHFDSRDELVAEALDLALRQTGRTLRERLFDGDKADFSAFLDFYLSEEHREARAEGCAVAALAGDAPRKGAAVQAKFREEIENSLQILSEVLRQGGSAASARASALLVLSALYGALIMARAVGDSSLSRETLQTVRNQLLNLSGPAKKKPRPRRSKRRKPKPLAEAGELR